MAASDKNNLQTVIEINSSSSANAESSGRDNGGNAAAPRRAPSGSRPGGSLRRAPAGSRAPSRAMAAVPSDSTRLYPPMAAGALRKGREEERQSSSFQRHGSSSHHSNSSEGVTAKVYRVLKDDPKKTERVRDELKRRVAGHRGSNTGGTGPAARRARGSNSCPATARTGTREPMAEGQVIEVSSDERAEPPGEADPRTAARDAVAATAPKYPAPSPTSHPRAAARSAVEATVPKYPASSPPSRRPSASPSVESRPGPYLSGAGRTAGTQLALPESVQTFALD